MQNLSSSDNKILTSSEISKKECECDNAWQLTSLSEEELQKWEIEKTRYYEICEYFKEVNNILDLIKPFPRDKGILENDGTQNQNLVKLDLKDNISEPGRNNLENIIKLVEKLKELQDKSYRQQGRSYFGKDLKKLREHKKKLKSEKLKQIINEESKKQFLSDLPTELEEEFSDLKNKSGSEDLSCQENWKEREKSECLQHDLGENKSKISKWTKVKEAFHWEKAIHPSTSKPDKKFKSFQERNDRDPKYDDDYLPVQVWVFDDDNCLPAPPPPPPLPIPRLRSLSTSKNDDFLLAPPLQDFPSSSSSDRLDDFVFTDSSKKGSKSPDADSSGQFFPTEDNDDCGNGTRKSSSEEFITQISQKLSKQEEFSSSPSKSNKTTWSKVKDIIQTRRESLKKRPKKKISSDINQRRKLSSPPAIHFSRQIEDLSSTEEKLKISEEITYSKTVHEPSAEIISFSNDECTRKPMPLLTITLPSSDETKPLSCEVFDKRITKDEKPNVLTSFSCQAQYCEEKPKYIKSKSAQNQKLSRWVKVKRVFLTSSSPPRTSLDELGMEFSPTGLHKFGFLSDLESDDLSSGEWNDENLLNEKTKAAEYQMPLSLLQDDIKKSYQELQKKLSQEFDQKMREWDAKNEIFAKTDDLLPKTFNDDKIAGPKFKKNSAVPLPNINDLSPEFRKKLNDWKKMKSTQGSICTSPMKEDVQGMNSKIRIGEWQPWKSRYSIKHIGKCEQSSFDEVKKSEVKNNNLYPSLKQAKEEGNGSVLRDLRGKEHVKKTNYSRGKADPAIGWNPNEEKYCKKVAKVKDFQWVEKELQKILREKIRLEQEKEKYLQREARLKQMKRTMGPALPAQEILVKTPTGLIRFKGISQKFTKKLYEWEKARGIAPEASTFALLEERALTSTNNTSDSEMILQRSKSMGSIADLSTTLLVPGVTHYPSSLSLNDVDELKTIDEADVLDESLTSDHFRIDSDKQPEALLVEVEDVVEEAEIETDFPVIQCEIPKYTFASEEFNQLASPNDGQLPPIYCDAIQSKSESTKRILKPAEKISSTRDKVDKIIEWMEQMNKSSEIHKTITQQNCCNKDVPSVPEANVENDVVKKKGINKIENNESVILHTTPVVFPVLENTIDNTETKRNIKRTEGVLNKKANHIGATEKERVQTGKLKSVSKNQIKSDPEAIKQKIKEKITLIQRMSTEGSFNSKWKCDCNKEILDEKAETKKNELSESFGICNSKLTSKEFKSTSKENINSVNVLVPTIRKIYSPIKMNQGLSPVACSYVVDDIQTPETTPSNKCNTSENDKSRKQNLNQSISSNDVLKKLNIPSNKENLIIPVNQEDKKFATECEITSLAIGIPPLPNAPKLYKKLNTKETAPSIKMIIDKYNQKLSEKEWTNEGKNDGGKVIGWRSPVFGRRIEKVQKNFKEGDALKKNNEVQKSVSFDAVKSIPPSPSPEILCPDNSQETKIFKSNSVGIIKVPSQTMDSNYEYLKKLGEPETNLEGSFTTLRALKIKKAKEDFLSGRHSVSSDASSTPSISTKYSPVVASKKSNKLNTSVDTSTDNNLIKSISAETITSEQNKSQSDDQSFNGKNIQKSSSKFDLSSIKSKFRRMRWKRDKDSKLNSVATLCRQSLLIEIPSNSQSNLPSYNLSKSCPSSPVMTRSKQSSEKEPSKNNKVLKNFVKLE